MEQEKVFIGINEEEANFLVKHLEPKGFQLNKIGMHGRYYIAIDKMNNSADLLTLSALALELFKKRVLTDALSDNGIDSDEILKIINNEETWNLLSDDSLSILYSDIYKDLNTSQIIDVSFSASKHYAKRRKVLYEEVKERLGCVNQ